MKITILLDVPQSGINLPRLQREMRLVGILSAVILNTTKMA